VTCWSLPIRNPIERKLRQFTIFSDEERRVLDAASGEGTCTYAAREDIEQEGSKPNGVRVILAGWTCRYKLLADGRRQIISFLLPGDVCELYVDIIHELDHSVAALTPASVARISSASLNSAMGQHPRLAQALIWERIVTAAIQREWTINLGQRSAFERVAHLLCELFVRLRGIGLVQNRRCELPLTQTDLADATGLSAIHINRTLQELRRQDLITLGGKELYIPKFKSLADAAGFNDKYLHIKYPNDESSNLR